MRKYLFEEVRGKLMLALGQERRWDVRQAARTERGRQQGTQTLTCTVSQPEEMEVSSFEEKFDSWNQWCN